MKATQMDLNSGNRLSVNSKMTACKLVWAPYVGIFFYALACTVFWWRGEVPFPFLGGDTALHASYAAAIFVPEAFENDAN